MNQPELKLQADIVTHFNHNFPEFRGRLFAINNNSQNSLKGAINKRAGVKKGVSDLCFLCEGGKVIWIELKVLSRDQSEGQKKWQTKVESIGHNYKLARSFKEFYDIIKTDLTVNRPMNRQQKQYFDDMNPGEKLSIEQVRNPSELISSAMQYFDQFGTLQFNDDYTEVTKLNPIPTDGQIHVRLSEKIFL